MNSQTARMADRQPEKTTRIKAGGGIREERRPEYMCVTYIKLQSRETVELASLEDAIVVHTTTTFVRWLVEDVSLTERVKVGKWSGDQWR